MIEDRLAKSLTEVNFNRIDSTSPGIYFYYRALPDEVQIVSVMHLISGEELTIEQYEHILNQIKEHFISQGAPAIRLLSLIFTRDPYKTKQFCLDHDIHWIIDISVNKLFLYENQSAIFLDLKDKLEKMLEEEQNEQGLGNVENYGEKTYNRQTYNGQAKGAFQGNSIRVSQWYAPVNTTIIAINILVHIVVHYTELFGGAEKLISEGALSWQDVVQNGEYYRILTSMFLHANIGHIFNNMLVLLFVGANLERAVGKVRYIIIYFGAGIIAGISSISYNMWKGDEVWAIGASGAIFGVIGAMLYVIIINKGRLQNISGVQMILFAVLSLYGSFINVGVDNAAHIGGFVGGLLIAAIAYRRPKRRTDNVSGV
ncbi:MAG TPA: rhomboid family intramembrane serine protease [Mobilitalea sp.]|nr:rhomboid family intramembrane serine protease [Mobilitalea sp.]